MNKLPLHQKCHHGNRDLVHSTGSKVEAKVVYISLVVVKVEVEVGINKAEEIEEDTINKVTSRNHNSLSLITDTVHNFD